MAQEEIEEQLPQFGRYLSLKILGEGATSSVYLAKDPNLSRKVAIKVIKPHLLNSESLLTRFTTEARVVANLRHPNIVQVHDYDVQDDQQYLVMEYVEGPSLQSILADLDGQPIPSLISVYIAYQAALGLAAAHKQGLVHRDIKPDNMLLTADGTLKIADFGIAHIAEMGTTQVGDILGTPYFMAPEQTMAETPSAQTDLWAVGVVLYYCLTGHRPFSGANFSEIKRNIRSLNFQPMRNFVASLEDPLIKIVDTLLQNAPEDRRNATWLSQQLKKCLDDSGILEWEEFIRSFLGTLKSPSLTRTAIEYRSPVPPTEMRTPTKKGTRARSTRSAAMGIAGSRFADKAPRLGIKSLKVILPAFAAGLAVAVAALLYLDRGKAAPSHGSDVKPPSNQAIPSAPPVSPLPTINLPATPKEEPATASTAREAEAIAERKPASEPGKVPSESPSPRHSTAGLAVMGGSGDMQGQSRTKPNPIPPPSIPKAAVEAAEPVTLEITSSPPWAKVSVNGKLLGPTPISHKMKPGRYQLKVSHSKFPNQDRDTTVHLKSGKTAILFQFKT